MTHARKSKLLSLFICSFFVVQAAAQQVDDNTEQQRFLQKAVASSPECQGLPIDVPKSIIINDGNVLVKDPMLLLQMANNIRIQNQFQNCMARVENAVQQQAAADQANPSITARIQKNFNKFVSTIAVIVNSNKNGKIDGSDGVVALGRRG